MLRFSRVLDEAVAIGIAGPVDPLERAHDRRPNFVEELLIAGCRDVSAGDDNEERCRVDAAVIEAERYFTQRRHFAVAHLVQDLAWLCIGLGIEVLRLEARQPTQHTARK